MPIYTDKSGDVVKLPRLLIATLDRDSNTVYKWCHERNEQPNLFDRGACVADGIAAPNGAVLHPARTCRSTNRREKGSALHRHSSRSTVSHSEMAERWTLTRSNQGNLGRGTVRNVATTEAARCGNNRSLEPFSCIRWLGDHVGTRTFRHDSRASKGIFPGCYGFASGNHTTRRQG